jgi:anti-sigma28 factor (negative regulator of flagellin synthesis)
MKIKKGLGSELQSELAKGLKQRRANEQAEQQRAEESKTAPEGKVKLGLARAIHHELNPEEIQAERKEKIAALKEAIRSGSYNPPASEIAQAIGEEISFEILTQNGE